MKENHFSKRLLIKICHCKLNLYFSVLFIICLFFPSFSFSQGKEANIWYFGGKAGIDFNPGSPPVALLNSQMMIVGMEATGSASISDSNGYLLFYSDGYTIWNRNHLIMQNGLEMGHWSTQGAMIVPRPGNDHLYYFFNFEWDANQWQYNFQYSLIDMDLDNGNGAVVNIEKKIGLFSNASFHLTAVHHANGQDIWVLAHEYNSNRYFAYLVTSDNLQPPIISQAGSVFDGTNGYLKLSPNGGKVAAAIEASLSYEFLDIVDFNNETGVVSDANLVHKLGRYYGIEFSPDNSKLYSNGGHLYFFQYDLNAGSPQQILDSEVSISNATFGFGALQLGPDGIIYCTMGGYRLSVIHQPNLQGIACNFEQDAIYLGGRLAGQGLPSFIQSYLNDPAFAAQQQCLGDSTLFAIENTNGIDSVLWEFFIFPNTYTSKEFSPKFRFPRAGNFSVSLTVYSGNLHKTVTKQIKINAPPAPNLGLDILACAGTPVTLDAGSGFAAYWWNGVPGSATFPASDSGYYTVLVSDSLGCSGSDTIRVSYFPAPALDETNLNIAPTTCGGTTGSVTGLQITGQSPFAYQWTASGTPISAAADIYNLGAGLYELSVTDGFGCTIRAASYVIHDAGTILIDTASVTPAYCGNTDGTLAVTAVSGLGGMLRYFIKTGSDTLSQWGNGQFGHLAGGNYYIWVTDSSGCTSAYPQPLTIKKLTAPEITSATSTPETGTAADGTMTIIATGTGLSYSLNGAPPVSSGYFTGLSAGTYSVKVSNLYDCDTTFSVTVAHVTGIRLSAIAGNGSACLGKVAKAPLLVSNFRDVIAFETTIDYGKLIVACTGYIDAHAELADSLEVMVFPATGIVKATWKGTAPLTLPDSSELLQLVFSSQSPGNAPLLWDISPAASCFIGVGGNALPVDYTMGRVFISDPPEILPAPVTEVCEGELLMVWPLVQNGTGTISYQWQTPLGPLTGQEAISKIATPADNGLYRLIATDTVNCADTATMTVNVIPTPVAGFTADTIYFDGQTRLEAAQGYNGYAWNTGDSTYSVLVASEGWYKVTLTTAEGCKASDSAMMLYAFVPLAMPNAFTPNGDGQNDIFRPVALREKISSFGMYIYGRWGQQVFFTNDIAHGWDGAINGSPAPLGMYTYTLLYGNPSGETRKKMGMVMLVR